MQGLFFLNTIRSWAFVNSREDCEVNETVGYDEILIETSCLDRPLLVKVSYHPNWQVEGAGKIYLASPSFMLIYPKESKIRLFYGQGSWDRLGFMLTLLGIVVLLLNTPLPTGKGQTAWSHHDQNRPV